MLQSQGMGNQVPTGYKELAAVLRAAILGGDYPPGSTLPKQPEIAERFGVNVGTVRKAVGLLEAEGLVTAVRRRGTVVRSRPSARRLGSERYARSRWKFAGLVRFAADGEASGITYDPLDPVAPVRRIPADPEIAAAFDIDPGQEVYQRAWMVREARTPTHTVTSYYLPAHVKGTPLALPEPAPGGPGWGFQVLTIQGLEPDHMAESLSARMPTPDERERLRLPAGEPVVEVERRTFTAQGQLVELARSVHAASRFAWTYTFPVPD